VIEMSAKLPKGRGTWSAFWLLSANRPLNWPSDGEIDIMEAVGYEVNPSKVYGSIHCHDFFGGNSKTQNTPINDPYNSFHTYKVDWNSKRINYYVDNNLYFTYNNPNRGHNSWPFDGPMNIILNNAIGGGWGGQQGVDDSIFPTQYVIDYVRVYAPNN
jgi:beta-glucanase (GH16 family)